MELDSGGARWCRPVDAFDGSATSESFAVGRDGKLARGLSTGSFHPLYLKFAYVVIRSHYNIAHFKAEDSRVVVVNDSNLGQRVIALKLFLF